jgi:hypothetical protein
MGMMLSNLTKKLCPLVSLAIAFGCGKKISDPKATTASTQGQTLELSTDLKIEVNESESPFKRYELPKNAWFQLPTKLLAKEGNAIGKQIKIYYNLWSSGKYEFQCSYRSTSKATELAFEKCVSSSGVEIISNSGDMENVDFPMDKGASVKVQLTNPTGTGMRIESSYIVDWK